MCVWGGSPQKRGNWIRTGGGEGVVLLSQGSGKAGGVQKRETEEEKEKRLQFPGSEQAQQVRVCTDRKGWRPVPRRERKAH